MSRISPLVAAILLAALVLLVSGLPAPTAEAGGGAACKSSVITEAAGAAVEIEGFCYEPTVLRIEPGQSVRWTNRDGAPHTVSGANFVWGDFTQLNEGESISFIFREAGTYPYYCALHPAMVGAVVVGDPDAAATISLASARPGTVSDPLTPAATEAGAPTAASVLPWLAIVAVAGLAVGSTIGLAWRRSEDPPTS
jgi:plastocyanin